MLQQQRREAALAAQAGPLRVVAVQRPADIEEARSGLPITGMEQEVVEAVALHDVVVLCGQTGCGKTTQVGWKGRAGGSLLDSCRLRACLCVGVRRVLCCLSGMCYSGRGNFLLGPVDVLLVLPCCKPTPGMLQSPRLPYLSRQGYMAG
jgi:hypothetical protein